MFIQYSIWVIGAIISGAIGFALSDKKTWRQITNDVLISALFGTGFVTVLLLQYELSSLRELRNEILHPDVLEKLETIIKESSIDTPMINSIRIHKDLIEEELTGLLEGRVKLKDEEEVIDEWERMFGESGTVVCATNYVSTDFWVGGSEFSLKQLLVQEKAIKDGVAIRRIFIYDDETEIDRIRKLALQQNDLGIRVRFIKKDKVESMPAYSKYAPTLGGAIDFVIFDLNRVLLTYVDGTRNITMGELSKERKRVDNARDLFEKMWAVSEAIQEKTD